MLSSEYAKPSLGGLAGRLMVLIRRLSLRRGGLGCAQPIVKANAGTRWPVISRVKEKAQGNRTGKKKVRLGEFIRLQMVETLWGTGCHDYAETGRHLGMLGIFMCQTKSFDKGLTYTKIKARGGPERKALSYPRTIG